MRVKSVDRQGHSLFWPSRDQFSFVFMPLIVVGETVVEVLKGREWRGVKGGGV